MVGSFDNLRHWRWRVSQQKAFWTYVVWQCILFISSKYNTESLPTNFLSFVMFKGKENCTSRPGPVRCIQGTIVCLLRVTAACPVVWHITDVFGYTYPELSNYFYTILWKLKSIILMVFYKKNKKFCTREIKSHYKI